MSFNLDFGGRPADWVVQGGKPAAIWPTGMPSFEHEQDRNLRVYDLLVCQADSEGQVRLFSRWYGSASVISPDAATVPLYHDPDAQWWWRPIIYRWHAAGYWEGQGSQVEIEWRASLAAFMAHMYAGADYDLPDAMDRAEEVLRENLTATQRLEWLNEGAFRVRGFSGRMYRVKKGNGFALISPYTGEAWASFCLHPEYWMPHADVALSTKLLLEDEDLEAEAVGNASFTPLRPPTQQVLVGHEVLRKLEAKLF